MTKEEKIKLASRCSMAYVGDDEDGDPEFIGTDEEWRLFAEKMDEELINESNRQIQNDKSMDI